MRTVIVSGGVGGIGSAIVKRFLSSGDRVVVADLPRDDIDSQLDRLAVNGNRPLFQATDVADPAACKDLADFAAGVGPASVLVNCAGGGAGTAFPQTEVDEWHRMRQLNLDSVFYVSKFVTPQIIASGLPGRIIHISSLSAMTGGPDPAYAAAKGGLISMMYHMVRELGPKGVTVNCVAPGIIETENMHRILPADLVTRIVKGAAEHTAVGRVGLPDDIAAAVHFLASDDAGFITGAVLPVTGGRHVPPPLTNI